MSRITISLTLVSTVALATPLAAQPGPANSGEIVYRLNGDATYQSGCFDNCLCPIEQERQVIGTFIMGPAIIGDAVDFHEIREINWQVLDNNNTGAAPITITGSGLYRITNFGPPLMHALDLELSIDGGKTKQFFSDFVPVTSNDGTIEIPVSMNGLFCFDILIHVNASPVPPAELQPYKLVAGSTFQRGCFDPCDCALEAPRPMRGSFQLVKILDYGTYRVYAVVRARFRTLAQNAPSVNSMIMLSGFGHYVHIDGFAGPIQSMDLRLKIDGDGPFAFDSGLHNAEPIFPSIDIAVDMNDQVCFDTVLTLMAEPAGNLQNAAPTPAWNARD